MKQHVSFNPQNRRPCFQLIRYRQPSLVWNPEQIPDVPTIVFQLYYKIFATPFSNWLPSCKIHWNETERKLLIFFTQFTIIKMLLLRWLWLILVIEDWSCVSFKIIIMSSTLACSCRPIVTNVYPIREKKNW